MSIKLSKVSCNETLDLELDTQRKVYDKIKQGVDQEGYFVVSIKYSFDQYVSEMKRLLLNKLKVYMPDIETVVKKKNMGSDDVQQQRCCGIALLDRMPLEALRIQTSPGMLAVFSTLLGTTEIHNAFDVPQVVLPGEYQHYKGINVMGNGYVGLLTLTDQTLGNKMKVPAGSLVVYDVNKAGHLMGHNPVKSECWLGIRITYWKQDVFDQVTRNAIFVTGTFGVHMSTGRARRILPKRMAMLKEKRILHSCISWNDEVSNIEKMMKETERFLYSNEPFPRQLLWDKEKKKFKLPHGATAFRCPHKDCSGKEKVYVNINLHMRLKHKSDQEEKCSRTTEGMDKERKEKKKRVTFQDTSVHDVENVPTKRLLEDDDRVKRKQCNRLSVTKKLLAKGKASPQKEITGRILSQGNMIPHGPCTTNKHASRDTARVENIPTKRCLEEEEKSSGRENKLSMKKKFKVTSRVVPAAVKCMDEVEEMEQALKEMTKFYSPLSPITSSPEMNVEKEESLDQASNCHDSLPSTSRKENDDHVLHSTQDFMDLYKGTKEWYEMKHELSLSDDSEEDNEEHMNPCHEKTLPFTLHSMSDDDDEQEQVDTYTMMEENSCDETLPFTLQSMSDEDDEKEEVDTYSMMEENPCDETLPFTASCCSPEKQTLSQPCTTDQWYEQPSNYVNNQILANDLDQLEKALSLANMTKKRRPTKEEDDLLHPITSVLDYDTSCDDRDFSEDEEEYTVCHDKEKTRVPEKVPNKLHLQYDVCITLKFCDTERKIAVYQRNWMVNPGDMRSDYLNNLIFCDVSTLQQANPGPGVMFADGAYKKLRCYIKMRSQNYVYEVRGAHTVMDAVRIFHHGMKMVNAKKKRNNRDDTCFMLCDPKLYVSHAEQDHVYEIMRIPKKSDLPLNQQYLVYDPKNVRLDYTPWREEPHLPSGICSVVRIPRDRKERIRQFAAFLRDKFTMKHGEKNCDKDRCKEIAEKMLDACQRMMFTKSYIEMPNSLEMVIVEHQKARGDIIKCALDMLLDKRMEGQRMKAFTTVASRQITLMKQLAKQNTVIAALYKKTDYLGEGDILLLGIVMNDQDFIEGLRKNDVT